MHDSSKYHIMSAQEVAEQIGNISTSGVEKAEQSALRKLRRSPILFLLWLEAREKERISNNVGTEL